MAVQLPCNNPSDLLKPGEHLYADVNCSISADGFSVEDGTFWTPSGHLLATSRQVRLAGT